MICISSVKEEIVCRNKKKYFPTSTTSLMEARRGLSRAIASDRLGRALYRWVRFLYNTSKKIESGIYYAGI